MKEQEIIIEDIDRKRILSGLGYDRANPPSKRFERKLDQLIDAAPRTVYTGHVETKIIDRQIESVITRAGTIKSINFAALAIPAEKVIFGLATAGTQMDDFLYDCKDMVDSIIADAIGSVVVEQGVDMFCRMMREEYGQYVSLPFSPGYCDYPLTEQETVLKPLGKTPLGVSWHPVSFVMTPAKTISFVLAAGDHPLQTNPCILCQLKNCRMKRSA